jgi:small-conductance mechanosensitive channel
MMLVSAAQHLFQPTPDPVPTLAEPVATVLSAVPGWVVGLLALAATWAGLSGLLRLLVARLGRLARRTRNDIDDLLLEVLSATGRWFIVLVSVVVGGAVLRLPAPGPGLLRSAAVVGLGVQAGLWLTTLLGGLLRLRIGRDAAGSDAGRTTLGALRFLVHLAVWSAVVLLVLANLGVDVTALIAGLGVGGVAIALAVQNILGDLFASLSIVLDRPFEVGDFIIVDDFMGTVQHVGLKTTRVRSLSGEQLIFSNAGLLGARIRNYQRMQERRIAFSLGVVYQTPPALVREIPALIQVAIEAAPLTRFERAHFREFGDSALVFEAVYHVLDADYTRYMDTQQAINLGLLESFADRGIEFAYPTQTLYLTRP